MVIRTSSRTYPHLHVSIGLQPLRDSALASSHAFKSGWLVASLVKTASNGSEIGMPAAFGTSMSAPCVLEDPSFSDCVLGMLANTVSTDLCPDDRSGRTTHSSR